MFVEVGHGIKKAAIWFVNYNIYLQTVIFFSYNPLGQIGGIRVSDRLKYKVLRKLLKRIVTIYHC